MIGKKNCISRRGRRCVVLNTTRYQALTANVLRMLTAIDIKPGPRYGLHNEDDNPYRNVKKLKQNYTQDHLQHALLIDQRRTLSMEPDATRELYAPAILRNCQHRTQMSDFAVYSALKFSKRICKELSEKELAHDKRSKQCCQEINTR